MIEQVWQWLTTAAHWSGDDGIWMRIGEHMGYTLIAVVAALALAVPVGAFIGHTGKGVALIAGLANALRAVPSLGLLVILALWSLDALPISIALQTAAIIVLVFLAIPPILTATYAGVAAVDPATRDAAAGMGMKGSQVLFRVEMPNALPLVFSGLRSAFLQTVATATIAAFVSIGGLGRYVLDGLAQHDYTKMAAGALLVAVLAIISDLILALIGYLVISAGLTGRRTRASRSAAANSGVVVASAA